MPDDPVLTAAALEAELAAAAVPGRAEFERGYLKSELAHHGVPVPACRGLARSHRRAHPDATAAEVLGLAEALWAEPVHERRLLAALLLEQYAGLLRPAHLRAVEAMLREARTWALVDVLAGDVVGRMAEPPSLTPTLDRWARDPDVWLRRSALLAHTRALRAGEGDWERFARYADDLLGDREFWVRKAIGWTLRDTARRRPELVAGWLLPRAARAAGLTVREAVKHLPPEDAAAIRAAHAQA